MDEDQPHGSGLWSRQLSVFAYKALLGSKYDYESSDKVILPSSSLQQLVDEAVEFPVVFVATNPETDRECLCSVIEFTAPEDVVIMPYWMMEHLCVLEGGHVQLTTTKPPVGKYIKFHVIEGSLQVSNVEAHFQVALRKFATLTNGAEINFQVEGQDYRVRIDELRPADGVSVLNADIEFDVQMCDDEQPQQPVRSSGVLRRSKPASAHAPPPPAAASPAKPADPFGGAGHTLGVNRPAAAAATTPVVAAGGGLVFGTAAKPAEPAPAAAAGHSANGKAPDGGGRSLGRAADLAAGDDGVECGNCGRRVPAATHIMHEAQCFRNTFRCPKCAELMSKAAADSHREKHALVGCVCGEQVEAAAMAEHRSSQCAHRQVRCQYCSTKTLFCHLHQHEYECGARTDLCVCGRRLMLRDLPGHRDSCPALHPHLQPTAQPAAAAAAGSGFTTAVTADTIAAALDAIAAIASGLQQQTQTPQQQTQTPQPQTQERPPQLQQTQERPPPQQQTQERPLPPPSPPAAPAVSESVHLCPFCETAFTEVDLLQVHCMTEH